MGGTAGHYQHFPGVASGGGSAALHIIAEFLGASPVRLPGEHGVGNLRGEATPGFR